jgi:hypothetical protein
MVTATAAMPPAMVPFPGGKVILRRRTCQIGSVVPGAMVVMMMMAMVSRQTTTKIDCPHEKQKN